MSTSNLPARPWLRRLLIAAGIVAVLATIGFIGGTIWLNSFIHSDSFRHEVEARAGKELNGTVEIKQIDLGLLGGVKLQGLATKLTTDEGTIGATVENVSCSYSLLSLLSRRLDIDTLTIKSPEIVLTQQPPSSTPPHFTSMKAKSASTEAAPKKVPPFQFSLQSAKITNGHLTIKDSTGATKADLLGLESDTKTAGYFTDEEVTGTLKIKTIALPENLTASDFSTAFIYKAGAFETKTFQASAFSGTITGDYKLDVTGPSLLTVKAEHIDLAQVGKTAAPTMPTKMSGSLDLQSAWHEVETGRLTGEGDAQIGPSKIEGVTLMNELATALKLPALHDPDFKSITTHFEVANGTTHFSHLLIQAASFEMTGSGTISPKGDLSADMVMTLHPDAMKQIPGIATSAFTKLPDGGGSIPFHLGGTVINPQSDTMTSLFISGSKVQKTISKTLKDIFN